MKYLFVIFSFLLTLVPVSAALRSPGSSSFTGTVTSVECGTGLSGGVITTTGVCAVTYGSTANTAAQGNDSRFSASVIGIRKGTGAGSADIAAVLNTDYVSGSLPALFTTSGAASTPSVTISGTPFAGTASTSFPLVYLNQTGATASASLTTGGTFIGINSSGALGDFLNFMVNGASKIRITQNGALVGGTLLINQSNGSATTSIGTGSATGTVTLGGGANDVAVGSHLVSTGTTPASPTSCGTGSPTIVGTDSAGAVTTGTGATTCTISFATTFTTLPKSAICTTNSIAASCAVTSLSATSMTLGLSGALSGVIYYWVIK